MSNSKIRVFHPLLFALYAVLGLLAVNIRQANLSQAARPLILALAIAFVILLVLTVILRNRYKAGLLVTLGVALFFSYGHVFQVVDQWWIGNVDLGKHSYWGLVWLLIFVILSLVILTRKSSLEGITRVLNWIAVFAVSIAVIQLSVFQVRESMSRSSESLPLDASSAAEADLTLLPLDSPPDIYFVVLDSYTRADVLQGYFSFDNQPFLSSMENRGAQVLECSRSNYSMTELSLAATLNLGYIQPALSGGSTHTDQLRVQGLLQDNLVMNTLQEAGYKIVSVESGFSPTEFHQAEVFLTPQDNWVRQYLLSDVNSFETLVLKTSAGIILYDARFLFNAAFRTAIDGAYVEHRDRTLFELDQLAALAQMDSPKFVFVHVLAPHEPFVFDAEGETVPRETPFALNNDFDTLDPRSYVPGYRDQVQYLNTRMAEIVDTLIAQSEVAPVIIIQGDHGSLPRVSSEASRHAVLNILYLPGVERDAIPETLSLVNTFRVVFNSQFGLELPMLEDISYYSTYEQPFDFTILADENPACLISYEGE